MLFDKFRKGLCIWWFLGVMYLVGVVCVVVFIKSFFSGIVLFGLLVFDGWLLCSGVSVGYYGDSEVFVVFCGCV